MRAYLLDTWLLIAQMHHADADHDSAERLWRRYRGTTLVTHDGVLSELLTYFAEFGELFRNKASTLVRALPSLGIEIVPQDRALFLRALALYEKRPDEGYSLVDCMSFVIMRERGVTHVLTNDHHFRQEGFTVVSE